MTWLCCWIPNKGLSSSWIAFSFFHACVIYHNITFHGPACEIHDVTSGFFSKAVSCISGAIRHIISSLMMPIHILFVHHKSQTTHHFFLQYWEGPQVSLWCDLLIFHCMPYNVINVFNIWFKPAKGIFYALVRLFANHQRSSNLPNRPNLTVYVITCFMVVWLPAFSKL